MNVKVTSSSNGALAALLVRSHRKHGKTMNDAETFRFRVNFNSVWTNPCPLWNSLGSADRTLSILVYHTNTYFLRAKTKKNSTEAVNLAEGQTWMARPWCPSLLSGWHWVRERIELVTALYTDTDSVCVCLCVWLKKCCSVIPHWRFKSKGVYSL